MKSNNNTDNQANDNNTTITATDILGAIGMQKDSLKELTEYMTVGRYKQGLNACRQWCKVGELVSRIKTAKVKGKLGDHVNLLVGTEISANERTFSKKMYDNQELVIAWYIESGCSKHNPRTIFEAYDKRNDVPVERDSSDDSDSSDSGAEIVDNDATGTGEEVTETPKTSDIMQAVLNARKMYQKAVESGSIDKKDIELVKRAVSELNDLINK